MKNKIKKIISITAAVTTVFATMPNVNASVNYDEGEDLPIIEGYEIAEFFNADNADTEKFQNIYITIDGKMEGLNTIITCDNIFKLSKWGFYSVSGKVWTVFNDHGTYNFEDDEIIQIFEAPTNDSEELAIYEEIFYNVIEK